jgi:hypothetical protein
MADVSFTPTFTHTPWVDNKDRVQAGGTNGFNVRFAALENDLQSISGAVDQINTALDALEAGTGPVSHVLTIAPTMNQVNTGQPWSLDTSGYALRTAGSSACIGLAPVTLPNGVTLGSFRASGQNSGAGVLRIALLRAHAVGIATAGEQIVSVNGDANPFDHTVPITGALAAVDTTTFRYFVLAQLAGADAAADVVTIAGFQISYLA